MKVIRQATLAAALATSLLLFAAPGALACSGPEARPVAQVVADPTEDSITGFYELEVVARAPNLFVRGERSATVVTRVWGAGPEDLGVFVQGNAWLTMLGESTCGPGTGDGTYVYATARSPEPERLRTLNFPLLAPENGIRLDPSEVAMLESAFGPTLVREISALDRMEAYGRLWVGPVLVVGVLGWLGWWLRRRSQHPD